MGGVRARAPPMALGMDSSVFVQGIVTALPPPSTPFYRRHGVATLIGHLVSKLPKVRCRDTERLKRTALSLRTLLEVKVCKKCQQQIPGVIILRCPEVRYSQIRMKFGFFLLCVSDLISHPVLATFPMLLEQPDVMDALRVGTIYRDETCYIPVSPSPCSLSSELSLVFPSVVTITPRYYLP